MNFFVSRQIESFWTAQKFLQLKQKYATFEGDFFFMFPRAKKNVSVHCSIGTKKIA